MHDAIDFHSFIHSNILHYFYLSHQQWLFFFMLLTVWV